MTRFHAPEGHTGGQYTARYEHEGSPQTGKVAERVVFVVAHETPGRDIKQASFQEDERQGIDYVVEDLKLGQVKVQFKAKELNFEEIKGILNHGVVPIGIEGKLALAGMPGSPRYREEAREFVRDDFWSQFDAFAPIAQEVRFGGKVDDERIHEAIEKAEHSPATSHYEGPQSFSPN